LTVEEMKSKAKPYRDLRKKPFNPEDVEVVFLGESPPNKKENYFYYAFNPTSPNDPSRIFFNSITEALAQDGVKQVKIFDDEKRTLESFLEKFWLLDLFQYNKKCDHGNSRSDEINWNLQKLKEDLKVVPNCKYLILVAPKSRFDCIRVSLDEMEDIDLVFNRTPKDWEITVIADENNYCSPWKKSGFAERIKRIFEGYELK